MGKMILIVDDDPVGTKLMASRLSKENYTVLVASDGMAGLASLKAEVPDLLVLDIEMPEMNGYSVLLEKQKDPAIKDIPVIVQTAHEENRGIFARRGISHYLVKPVNFDLLLAKIRELTGE